MDVVVRNSPNQSARIHGDAAVRLVVAHTPEGPYRSMVEYLMRESAKVSYHLLIREDGADATQLVPWSRKAWHAGPMNSLSDGIAVAGRARDFEIDAAGNRKVVGWEFEQDGEQALAKAIAQRLVARELPCQWTTDTVKGGFCRHADLQDDRSDPTPDLGEWRVFVSWVKHEYEKLTAPAWPKQIPAWFWRWARWRLGEGEFKLYGPKHRGMRPKDAPWFIKPWAWARLRALLKERPA